MNEFTETLNNGNLVASIDWLAFSITDNSIVLDDFMEEFGLDTVDFVTAKHGAMGYKKLQIASGYELRVLSDGLPEMGFHVQAHGGDIGLLLKCYQEARERNGIENTPWGYAKDIDDINVSLLSEIMKYIREHGKVKRVDLALDDIGENYYSTNELWNIIHIYDKEKKCDVESPYLSTKFKGFGINSSYSVSGGACKGMTVYFGSRQSEIYLRVYDKALEQKEKKNVSENSVPWVRWELELKDDRAAAVCTIIEKRENFGKLAMQILSSYVRLIVPGNKQKCRCQTDPKWQDFVNEWNSVKLTVKDEKKTLEDKESWLVRQVMPTIAGLSLAYGGDMDFLYSRMESGKNRMNKQLRELVSAVNPEYIDEMRIYE